MKIKLFKANPYYLTAAEDTINEWLSKNNVSISSTNMAEDENGIVISIFYRTLPEERKEKLDNINNV